MNPGWIHFTVEQLQEMARRYVELDQSSEEIGASYGISVQAVIRRLRDMGVTIRPVHRITKIKPKDFMDVHEMRQRKVSWADIGKKYDIDRTSAAEWYKKQLAIIGNI